LVSFTLFSLLFVTTNVNDVLSGDTRVAAIDVIMTALGKDYGCFVTWLIILNVFLLV
jgi:hypothetical protein